MSTKRLCQFEKEFSEVDMADFYKLNKKYEKMEIGKEIHSDFILLTIQYKKTNPCPDFDLPAELIQLIHDYLIYIIQIKIKIKYSPSYPFSPPIWFLQGVNHNLATQISLLDYYSYKVNQHNQSYISYILNMGYSQSLSRFESHGWNPAITVEKDILSFIQKINHFDEVLICAW